MVNQKPDEGILSRARPMYPENPQATPSGARDRDLSPDDTIIAIPSEHRCQGPLSHQSRATTHGTRFPACHFRPSTSASLSVVQCAAFV